MCFIAKEGYSVSAEARCRGSGAVRCIGILSELAAKAKGDAGEQRLE